MSHFQRLLGLRWKQVSRCLALPDDSLTWDIGEADHFREKRGYALAIPIGSTRAHLRFSQKILTAPNHRQDGVIQHELGHVVDFLVPKAMLNQWAVLPKTSERRADKIAEIIWGKPILYDTDFVQSTRHGTQPRPRGLGL